MKRSVVRASLVGAAVAVLAGAPPADAARPKSPRSPPPDNIAEWKLINLIGETNGTKWDLRTGVDTSKVVVGLFDGLSDCRHADLTGHCENYVYSGASYRFYSSHGTHTAGIVAGNKTGVAPGAKILNYAVFDDRGYVATGSKLINGWTAAAGKGATIASMSFGCTGTALCFSPDEVRAMGNIAMLYVKAAGNDGKDLASEAIGVTQSEALAALQRTILVGSVELNSSMSSYSNRAGNGCLLYSGDTSCDTDMRWMNYFMVAPGSSIYSTLPGNTYGLMSGTSMATPMVAGAAALLKAKWPALTAEQLADILLGTAKDLGAPGTDPVYGHGLLDVANAFSVHGDVTLLGTSGGSSVVTTSISTSTPALNALSRVLGSVTVYDRYGRDFTLAQTGRLQLIRTYDSIHRLLGRHLIGLGSQTDWAAAYFADRHVPYGFGGFGSYANPVASNYVPDRAMRMGVDMPFKGGVAQLRMTGSSSAREDFAYDPSLRPLSFFASTALLKSSLFGQTLLSVGKRSRLAVYATTNSPGAINARNEPLLLQELGANSTAQLALTSIPAEQRQHGFGVGYWTMPDRHTVLGLNTSYLVQRGGFYDMASTLPGLDGTSKLFNVGVVASRSMDSWEVSAAGEVTHIRNSGTSELLDLTPSNIASAELRVRKAGVAFSNGEFADSLSIALVMPPRAVSGSLRLDYMGPTADRMGRQPYSVRYALGELGADPVKVEAGYRLAGNTGWALDVSGGVNLRQTQYAGRGEALANFHFAF